MHTVTMQSEAMAKLQDAPRAQPVPGRRIP
jgi:hypothetical protein